MEHYDYIRHVPPNAINHNQAESEPVNLKPLCQVARRSTMEPLSPGMILGHSFGRVAIGVLQWSRGSYETWYPLAYAGITKYVDFEGDHLAVVGGIVAKKSVQGTGLAFRNTNELLKVAASDMAVDKYGHQGFLAYCNDQSVRLFGKLGFDLVGSDEDKIVMRKNL